MADWSRKDINRLRQLLTDGELSWGNVAARMGDFSKEACKSKARDLKIKNMYYVYNEQARYKKNNPPPPPPKPVFTTDPEFIHSNGTEVWYA